jgi:putative transposase
MAYQFALDPTPGQVAALRSHCGAQRYVFNWGLRQIRANLAQREAERSYGIPESELTLPVDWSAYGLRKSWNRVKDEVAPWWAVNSKEAYSSGLANLAAALRNWSASKAGKRRGRKVRFPRFKGRRAGMSCRFTTGAFGLVEADRRHVKLPRIGTVRTHESTRKLARHLERGTGRIRSTTVSYRRGRWFVSFTVEVERNHRRPVCPGSVVGVDLGVKRFAVLSTGQVIANPKHLELALSRLRRLHRQAARRLGPDRRTPGQQPSHRWRRTQTRIARVHTRVANARRDGLHQLSTRLATTHGTIVVEDLHLAGMVRNRRLARHLAGVGMGELRRQLEYKTLWYGSRLVVADRWYPSSKTCSACGVVRAKLRLSERTYTCDQCGLVLDRDLNAARNLATLASVATGGNASSSSCGATLNEPAGNPRKTHLVGNGYRHGKTLAVNAPPQGEAASRKLTYASRPATVTRVRWPAG